MSSFSAPFPKAIDLNTVKAPRPQTGTLRLAPAPVGGGSRDLVPAQPLKTNPSLGPTVAPKSDSLCGMTLSLSASLPGESRNPLLRYGDPFRSKSAISCCLGHKCLAQILSPATWPPLLDIYPDCRQLTPGPGRGPTCLHEASGRPTCPPVLQIDKKPVLRPQRSYTADHSARKSCRSMSGGQSPSASYCTRLS